MTLRRPDASPRATAIVDATLRRRSSRLSRWLLELQTPNVLDLSNVDPVGTRSNPYLAYPHLSMAALRHGFDDDADSMHDYVVVDEDIALECPPENALYDQVRDLGFLLTCHLTYQYSHHTTLRPQKWLLPDQQSDLSTLLNHYGTFISRDAQYHPLRGLRHLPVLPSSPFSANHLMETFPQAQAVYLIIHEARVSKHHCPEIVPQYLVLLMPLRGGGDRAF